ncbi:MAG: DUF1192 domain-containing protein [Alphaproteobacteria bacterium]
MFDEDGRKINIRQFPAQMDGMSVAELNEYISELQDEIARATDMIAKKKASEDVANSIFKS